MSTTVETTPSKAPAKDQPPVVHIFRSKLRDYVRHAFFLPPIIRAGEKALCGVVVPVDQPSVFRQKGGQTPGQWCAVCYELAKRQ